MIVKWFLCLIFYSFLGWIYESILCSIKEKKLINRGFLVGPIIPVYGVGGILSIALFQHRIDNIFILFITGVLLTGAVEYSTGYLLETIFHMKWWDYSNHRFNLQGRVCLQSVSVFGAMAAVIVKYIHPLVTKGIDSISYNVLIVLAACIFAILILDIFVTLNHLINLGKKLDEIQTALDKFAVRQRERAAALEETLLNKFESSEYYSEKIKKLLTIRKYHDKRLAMAFPKSRHLKYNEAWQKLKALGRFHK